MVEALNQKERQPMPVAEQVASIYAGTEGYLDRIKTERVGEFLANLIDRLHAENKDLIDRINETGQLSDEDTDALGKSIAQAIDDFGPDFDQEGNPLEEGESDRIKTNPSARAENRDARRSSPTRRVRRPGRPRSRITRWRRARKSRTASPPSRTCRRSRARWRSSPRLGCDARSSGSMRSARTRASSAR